MVSVASDLRLRRAGADDVGFLVGLRNALAADFLSQVKATRVKTLRLLASSHTYIIERNSRRLGTFALYNLNGDEAEFGRFMVRPKEQGNGVGCWALGQAIDLAAGLGIRRLHLVVKEGNRKAIEMYLEYGFRVHRLNGTTLAMERAL